MILTDLVAVAALLHEAVHEEATRGQPLIPHPPPLRRLESRGLVSCPSLELLRHVYLAPVKLVVHCLHHDFASCLLLSRPKALNCVEIFYDGLCVPRESQCIVGRFAVSVHADSKSMPEAKAQSPPWPRMRKMLAKHAAMLESGSWRRI